jgi:hypothetical protein
MSCLILSRGYITKAYINFSLCKFLRLFRRVEYTGSMDFSLLRTLVEALCYKTTCGGQNGAGAGFLRVLRFPLPKPFIPSTSPSSQSPRAGTIGQEWPQCRVDPVWTPPSNIQIQKLMLQHGRSPVRVPEEVEFFFQFT